MLLEQKGNPQITTVKLTSKFFSDTNILMNVSAETRMRLLWSIYNGTVLPITYTVEAQFLTSAPAYEELKLCVKLRSVEVDGVATITFTKKALDTIGIRLTYKKVNTDGMACKPYVSTEHEKQLHTEALYVLTCYNEAREELYRSRGDNFIPSPIVFTPDCRKVCIKIVEFCANYHIDNIRIFIFAIYKNYQWKSPPPLKMFPRPEAYDQWVRNKDTAYSEVTMMDEMKKQTKNLVPIQRKSPFRDLYSSIEKTKAVFVRDKKETVCMAQIRDLLGYHPKSSVCIKCKLAEPCKLQLISTIKMLTKGIMNIIELRNGKQELIDVQQQLLSAGLDLDVYEGGNGE